MFAELAYAYYEYLVVGLIVGRSLVVCLVVRLVIGRSLDLRVVGIVGVSVFVVPLQAVNANVPTARSAVSMIDVSFFMMLSPFQIVFLFVMIYDFRCDEDVSLRHRP